MKRSLCFVVGLLFSAAFALAAEQTWSGSISDSNCGLSHQSGAEHAEKKMSDHDCTVACVKGGGKYVFVQGGKVYNIENQNFAGLQEHAGEAVSLTGTMTGDTIKVSKIVAPAKKTKA
jgi:hypothetical protein